MKQTSLERLRQGFTLVEMILTVTIMAILIGVSVPGVYQFIRMRDKQQEEVALQEIQKAVEAYLAEKNSLPSDTGDWATALSGYAKMNREQIANDVWGKPRSYILLAPQRSINGISLTINYLTVLSMGPDGAPSPTEGIAVSGNAFAGSSAATWWKAQADPVAAFAKVKVATGSDDLMLKFTDYASKLQGVAETSSRMNKTTDALESYARANYSKFVTYCNGTTKDANGVSTVANCQNGKPEQVIYTPYGSPATSVADTALYFDPSVDVSDPNVLKTASPQVVNNTADDATRRTQMQNLMRLLGMPPEYCCSSYENAADGLPKPFYYFSNPRQATGPSTCSATRPGPTDTKLPARITSTYICD